MAHLFRTAALNAQREGRITVKAADFEEAVQQQAA